MRGDRNKTDKDNKRKSTTVNPQIGHNRTLQKEESRCGLEHEHKDKYQWCIREAMEILRRGPETMNWDEDAVVHLERRMGNRRPVKAP